MPRMVHRYCRVLYSISLCNCWYKCSGGYVSECDPETDWETVIRGVWRCVSGNAIV